VKVTRIHPHPQKKAVKRKKRKKKGKNEGKKKLPFPFPHLPPSFLTPLSPFSILIKDESEW